MPQRQRWGFGCSPDSRKVANLSANPAVVVTVEDTVEAISIEGTARRIEGDDADPMIEAWVDKYADEIEVGVERVSPDAAAEDRVVS